MVTYLLSTELALGKYGIKEGYWCHLGNFPKHVVCKTIQRLESLETVKELRSYLFLAYTFRCLGSGVSGGSERGNGGRESPSPMWMYLDKGFVQCPHPILVPPTTIPTLLLTYYIQHVGCIYMSVKGEWIFLISFAFQNTGFC